MPPAVFRRIRDAAVSQYLPLSLISLMAFGYLLPQPGCFLADADFMKYCTFGVFVASGRSDSVLDRSVPGESTASRVAAGEERGSEGPWLEGWHSVRNVIDSAADASRCAGHDAPAGEAGGTGTRTGRLHADTYNALDRRDAHSSKFPSALFDLVSTTSVFCRQLGRMSPWRCY